VWYFGTKSSTFDTNVFYDMIFVCVLVLCTQVNIMFLMLLDRYNYLKNLLSRTSMF
jgi:hypothetical protein